MNEKEVILQLKEGDFKNFDIFYNKYYKKIFFLSLKIINDEKLAEDITQEVFLDMVSNLKTINNIKNFDSWINKVVINKTNKTFKKMYQQKKYINYNVEDFNNYINKYCTMKDVSLNKNLKEDLLYLIDKLPVIKKRAMILHFFYGFSLKEISLIEKVPLGTIKSRIYIAKKTLKKKIVKNYFLFIVATIIKIILKVH